MIKGPNVYARAAKALEEGIEFANSPVSFACHALVIAGVTVDGMECLALKELFAPNSVCTAWLQDKELHGDDAPDLIEDYRDFRILVLCFAAAMRDTGDL